MNHLVSKFQHYFFERGAFDNIKVRSFEETLSFIDNVSLHKERGNSPIGLDGPSVTIEHTNGTFLKLGIDYNNKFILYYLNVRNQIFFKSAGDRHAFRDNISTFFEIGQIDASFTRYRPLSSGNRKHFITGNFEYKFGIRRFAGLMLEPLLFAAGFLGFSLMDKKMQHFMLPIGLSFYLLMFGVNWLLLLNYYFFSKGESIKISKGIDIFYFGATKDAIQKYNKQDIQGITIYCNNKWSKCPWNAFHKFEIKFKERKSIQFTSLTISHYTLLLKVPNHLIEYKHQFIPGIKKAGKKIF